MVVREGTGWARLQRAGVASGTPIDLLTLALCRDPQDLEATEPHAAHLLRQYRMRQLGDVSAAELQERVGMDAYESLRFLATLELGRRVGASSHGEVSTITGDKDAYEAVKHIEDAKQEKVITVLLDTKNHILGTITVHIGTLDASLIGPREVFRDAVRENAAALVVAHNHPSGDPTPSQEDIAVTKRLNEVGEILGIRLLDHIIVGKGKYVSLRKEGKF